MIIKYYKGYVNNNYLSEITKTNKNGTTAFHLIEGAKQLGFECKGLKINFESLENIILPCIAHVTINETYNHYIVIYEINMKKKYLIIGDPATKLRKISFEEFTKIWDGIIITFIPKKPIPVLNDEITIKQFIMNLIQNQKNILFKVFLFSIFISCLSILASVSFKIFIDELSIGQTKQVLFAIFGIFLLFEIFKNLFNHIRNKFLVFISQKIDWFLTNDVFKQIISLPYSYYRNHTTGDIISRINDLRIIKDVFSKIVIILFVDLPLMLISSIVLYFINNTLFIISLIMIILLIFSYLLFNPVYKKLIINLHNKSADVNSYMVENISGFETIKGLSIENNIIDSFQKKYYKLCNNSLKLENTYNLHSALKNLINDIGILIIIFIGSVLSLDGKLSIGNLVAFSTLLGYFINPIKNIVDMDISLKEAKDALDRVLKLMVKKEDGGVFEHNVLNKIEFRNLNFSYDDRNLTLNNINLTINNNEKILIIGDSGSGKSTLLKLLMKFHKIDRNMLFIDDVDINDIKETTIKNNICYISQNEILFTDTLYNNLKLNRDIDDKNIEEKLDLCYIKNIFKNSNLGLNTLIEENGFNLSGGEKQRIILGRSLLKDFNILIIDEGLNQVDISLERKILKNILNKYSNKIIIVISHRLENMDLFDRVIKFKKSKIEEDLIRNV